MIGLGFSGATNPNVDRFTTLTNSHLPIKKHKIKIDIVDEELLNRLQNVLERTISPEPEDMNELSSQITYHLKFNSSRSFRVKKIKDGVSSFNPFTFWIELKNEGTETQIQINRPNIVLCSGTYKRIKSGLVINLPSFSTQEIVRLRPKNKQNWSSESISGFLLHKMIHDKVQDPEKGVRIAAPPLQRIDETKNKASGEYIQCRYPYTLLEFSHWYESEGSIKLVETLTSFVDLFSTIEAIHKLGYAHRDVKPPNIFLDAQLKMHLNDFDLCSANFHGAPDSYTYWDTATQKGLSNPFCDMVGAAICLLDVLSSLNNSQVNFFEDRTHVSMKKLFASDSIINKLKINSESERKTFTAVIGLACEIIRAEDKVYSLLLSSMVNHFIDLTKPYRIPPFMPDNKGPFKGSSVLVVNYGITLWAIERLKNPRICLGDGTTLTTYLEKNYYPLELSNGRDALKILKALIFDEDVGFKTYFVVILSKFFSLLTSEGKRLLNEVIFDFNYLVRLLSQMETQKNIDLESCSAILYRNLSSELPEKRVEGYSMLEKVVPSAGYVRETLKRIISNI